MPIAIVHSLPPPNRAVIPRMLENITQAGARAAGCDPDQFWAVFQEIRPGEYYEGDLSSEEPGSGTHPPIVVLRALAGRTPAVRLAVCQALARVIGDALSIPPENVWIHWQEMQPSDVFAGGRFHG